MRDRWPQEGLISMLDTDVMPVWPTDLCGCGLPLHYIDPAAKEMVVDLVDKHGAMVPITVERLGRFWVPRHFIALHGIQGAQVPALVKQFGWPQS